MRIMDKKEIVLIIDGNPFGKQRPRVVRTCKGASRAFTPEKTMQYESYVEVLYRQKYGRHTSFKEDDELHLDIKAYYEIAKSTPKYLKEMMLTGVVKPTKKPDVDNIIKIIADSLNGVAYKDDKQIVACSCQKFYASNPRVELVLSKVNEVELGEIKARRNERREKKSR